MSAIVERRPLPRMVHPHGDTVWWGVLFMIVIEAAVFASLILSYFYLRARAEAWPLGDIDPPALLLPTLNSLILLASVLPVAWADRAARRGDRRRLLIGKHVAQALLVVFLVVKVIEYSGYDYNWRTNAYGSLVWTMTGLHVAHVVVVLLKSGVVTALAWKRYFGPSRYVGVQANALYWYFVAAIWIPLYATIYLTPHVLQRGP